MRQFVLGLIVAAMAWWGYDRWLAGNPAQAGGSAQQGGSAPIGSGAGGDGAGGSGAGGAGNAIGSGASLSKLLGNRGDAGAQLPGSEPLNSGAPGTPAQPAPRQPVAELDDLLTRVQAGNAPAIASAWGALATGSLGREHARVVEALQPNGADFLSLLAALGDNNSFLHSREGRDAADKVLGAAMAMSDDAALKAGSQLLYLMTRGRIQRTDNAARAAVDKAYRQHRIRVDRWLCNPANVAGARSYTVKSGDRLGDIARTFRREGLMVEPGTLAVLNRIHNPNALQIGQRLKVPMAPVAAVLEKRSYALMVFVGESLMRLYWVGHGTNDRTPVTEFAVVAKQAQPQWTAPDGNVYPYGHPKNILGEYFIKFQHPQYAGFGAHGTPMPETICTMSSMGCIRMFDSDIAELFKILPRGAKVLVRATESLPN